ncbi:hypothetical protein ACEPAF_2345 [Sanghuangporus sanghuang]
MPEATSSDETTLKPIITELDTSLYAPSQEEIDFLKNQTKIGDEEELKQHILAVQREGWALVKYRCIQSFAFITLKISHLPPYQHLLKLGRERQGAIFLDLGCCVGNDVRKAVADGYPAENMVATDLVGAFWDLGHKLFKSTPETFPVGFIQGDVFDPQHLALGTPFYDPPRMPRPVLSMLTSLTPLQGHVSALHTSLFFHLFSKEEQIKLAHLIAPLLSPIPGSMIFGAHTSKPVSGESQLAAIAKRIYCFSPEDWCALWDGGVFKKGTIRAEAWFPESDPWRGKGFGNEPQELKRQSMICKHIGGYVTRQLSIMRRHLSTSIFNGIRDLRNIRNNHQNALRGSFAVEYLSEWREGQFISGLSLETNSGLSMNRLYEQPSGSRSALSGAILASSSRRPESNSLNDDTEYRLPYLPTLERLADKIHTLAMVEAHNNKTNGTDSRLPTVKLDPSLYKLSREEIDFMKGQTGIEDEEELKQHVISVQKEAWDVVNYKCIQSFGFLRLKMSRLPMYQDLLKLGKERPGAIFLDYACCFGDDARKAISDGYPIENVIASDIKQEFWDLGYKLFKSTPETFPVPFIQGDIFDPKHIALSPPLYSPPTTPRPTLFTLSTLTPLKGYVSAIHVSRFFHLFGKEDQITAARALASLLSPLPGSMIFGSHSTKSVSCEIIHPGSAGGFNVYCFAPEDWCALWDGMIFKKGTVEVKAELKDRNTMPQFREDHGTYTEETRRRPLVWCVKRI